MIPILICLLVLSGCAAQSTGKEGGSMEKGSYTQIDQETAKETMLRDDGHVIADVRRQDEYDGKKTIYLAGGCFWGTERVFKLLKGVTDTCVGYANGMQKDPRYEDIIRHNTGYRETVRVTYDPALISLEKVLKAYFLCIDPTEKDAQRGDVGTQYQTGVYYKDPALKERIERVFAEERKKTAVFQVELKPLECFYEAEEYHQDYLDKIPDGYCHITAVDLEKVKALNEE